MPSAKSKSPNLLNSIYGVDSGWIDDHSLEVPVHHGLVKPFLNLKRQAQKNGFDLAIASGYRNFDRQLRIWNEKANGSRVVYDDNDQPIDMLSLSPWKRVQAILRWSALPGASRHHWGTDIDIYDKSAITEDYTLRLSVEEVAEGGRFWPMHQWLDQELQSRGSGFFRPYNEDRNGVAPERWHLSYAPLAAECQRTLSEGDLMIFLSDKPLALKDVVMDHLSEIYRRFIKVPWKAYPLQINSDNWSK